MKRLFSHHQRLGTGILTAAIASIQLLSLAGVARPPRSVPGGARVALSFQAGTNFVLGDVIELTFTLSNAGAQAFSYETGGDYRGTGFPTRFKFTVVDEKGVALPAETWMDMGGLSGPRQLKPGEEYRQALRLQNYVLAERELQFVIQNSGGQEGDDRQSAKYDATAFCVQFPAQRGGKHAGSFPHPSVTAVMQRSQSRV